GLPALAAPVADPFGGESLGPRGGSGGGGEAARPGGGKAPPRADVPEHADAVLAPGRRQDARLDERAARREVRRRLVALVDEAHRHEKKARPDVDLGAHEEVEVGELARHLAALLVRFAG